MHIIMLQFVCILHSLFSTLFCIITKLLYILEQDLLTYHNLRLVGHVVWSSMKPYPTGGRCATQNVFRKGI